MRITPAILLAALVGCSPSSGAPGPREPAPAAGASAASGAASDDDRVAVVMASFEKMVAAFGPADGDCGAMAGRVRAFAATDDAEAIRRISRDEELAALLEARRAEIERDYGALTDRLIETVRSCSRDQDFEQAMDESKLFVIKERVVGEG